MPGFIPCMASIWLRAEPWDFGARGALVHKADGISQELSTQPQLGHVFPSWRISATFFVMTKILQSVNIWGLGCIDCIQARGFFKLKKGIRSRPFIFLKTIPVQLLAWFSPPLWICKTTPFLFKSWRCSCKGWGKWRRPRIFEHIWALPWWDDGDT